MAKKETVLVTGGCGFLGRYTVEALCKAGYAVRVFDREACENISQDYEMIIGDIKDSKAVYDAAKGCSYIYHLAGMADIEEAKEKPLESAQINILGTLNILEAAKAHETKRVVFASTVYVYSDRGSFYRVSKQACENYIETYNDLYDIPYTILRYGSLYGRNAGETNGIFKLIKTGIENGEIIYNGDENAMREYIHITDAAKLSVDILDDQYANTHLVLTGNERMRIVDIMRMISEMLPNKPAVKFGDEKMVGHYVMTPYVYSPKLGQKLVSNQHVELGQGLLDCIAEFNEKNNHDHFENQKASKA